MTTTTRGRLAVKIAGAALAGAVFAVLLVVFLVESGWLYRWVWG